MGIIKNAMDKTQLTEYLTNLEAFKCNQCNYNKMLDCKPHDTKLYALCRKEVEIIVEKLVEPATDVNIISV